MKSLLGFVGLSVAGLILATACDKKQNFTLQGNFDESFNEKPVLLISLSSGDTLAYDTIRNGAFVITGDASVTDLAQVRIGGAAAGNVILEPGTIVFTEESVAGTPLNDAMNSYQLKYNDLRDQYAAIQNDSLLTDSVKNVKSQQLTDEFQAYRDSLSNANIDNPIGANFMTEDAYEMSAEELESAMEQHPSLKAYSKLKKILAQKKLALETSPGKPYKDFEVSYDGVSTKLSDLIQPDHYTLVDFWASWCGPCRREIPVIKEIRDEWGPKGLDVVGVAVWDEPDNTLKAMETLGIDWPVMINAQTIPTDIYGILGIPTIILIGPDGTILARDVMGQELKAAVASAMTK